MRKSYFLIAMLVLLFSVIGCTKIESNNKYRRAQLILEKFPESLIDSTHPKAIEVIDLLNSARIQNPTWWKPCIQLLSCYKTQQRYSEMVEVYRVWIQNNGNQLTNHQYLGYGAALEMNGETVKAKEKYIQAWLNLQSNQAEKKKITEIEMVAGVYAGFLSGLLTIDRYPIYTDWFGGKTSLYEFVLFDWKNSAREELLKNFAGY